MNSLALQGGGVLGYGQAILLSVAELRYGKPLYQVFDFVGGTSVGSIIAAPIAIGKPMAEVSQFFTIEAPKIFKSSWIDDVETVLEFGPKYPAQPLEIGLYQMLGDAKLVDCKTKFISTSYDCKTDRPIYFKSYEKSWDDDTCITVGYDSDIKLWQICRASSAAQTYFPGYTWGPYVMLDGGNAGDNAPDALMSIEALSFSPSTHKMLSIGSGNSKWNLDAQSMLNPGLIRAGLNTIKIVFSAGESADVYKAKRMLGSNHFRISPDLGAGIAIDDAQSALTIIPVAVDDLLNKVGGPVFFDNFTV